MLSYGGEWDVDLWWRVGIGVLTYGGEWDVDLW